MSPLAYLRQELKFTGPEWTTLSQSDKDTLKRWAVEEMQFLGITPSSTQ